MREVIGMVRGGLRDADKRGHLQDDSCEEGGNGVLAVDGGV